jgi:hypothetical protein
MRRYLLIMCCVWPFWFTTAAADDDLTPIGAERAGNARDHPPWTGGITTPPSNYDRRNTSRSVSDDRSSTIDSHNAINTRRTQ